MSSAGLSIERLLQPGKTVATRDHRDQDSLPESARKSAAEGRRSSYQAFML
jgi:hypothetical protein